MADQNWWEFPDQPGQNPNDNTGWTPDDPYNQAPQPPGQPPASAGGCAPGTFSIDIDASGHSKGAADGECVDQAEASRRNKLWIQQNPGGAGEGGGAGAGGGGGAGGVGRPGSTTFNPGKVPQFVAPQFGFDEKFQYPTLQEAQNEPGFQFRLGQGLGALQNTAAARGTLRGGSTLKGLNDYAQQFASQEYGNVANRALTGYNTRRDTAQQAWENLFRGSQAEYAPKLVGWQTNAQLGDAGLNREWNAYNRSTLSAADILAALGGYGA